MFEKRSFTFYQKRRTQKPPVAVTKNDRLFFNVLFLFVIGLVIYLIYPLINPIIIGVLTATLFYKFNKKVTFLCKGRRILGAAISTSTIFLLVVLPLIGFLYMAVTQGIEITNDTTRYLKSEEFQELVVKVQDYQFFVWVKKTFNIKENLLADDKAPEPEPAPDTEQILPPPVTATDGEGEAGLATPQKPINLVTDIERKPTTYQSQKTVFEKIIGPLKTFLANASKNVLNIISLAGNMIFSLLISLLVMFYVFCDGRRILRIVHHLSPLPKSQEDALFEQIRSISRSAMQGTFFTACCQGLVAMVGLAIAGLPALFLGTLFGITSMVPVVGTAIVLIPLLGYLLIINCSGTALFIFIWCMIFNNIVDYVIRPRLMKGEDNMPTVIMLFAIIGGVGRFGLLGFVYGPVIFGIMAVLLWIYEERNSLFLNGQDRK